MISNSSIKLEEITVSRQSTQLKNPRMVMIQTPQVKSGSTMKRILRKINANVIMIKNSIPTPKLTKSLLMKSIISAVIISGPPK